jgi:hypothetical protein
MVFMKKYHWLSLIGILLTVVLVIPVSAESVYTRFDNGSTLVGNGSYWMLWEPVGNHTVGDRFFVNGTTNLPEGTVLAYQFFNWHYTRIKNPGTGGVFIIGPGGNANYNIFSFIVNTTDLLQDRYYLHFLSARHMTALPIILILFRHHLVRIRGLLTRTSPCPIRYLEEG